MGLIIVQGRSPIVIASRGRDGVGVASVLIDEDKHLIITLTNGVTHDAGPLPSSDEVETLATQLAAITARVKALEDGAPGPGPDLDPEAPENALADSIGRLLVSASGAYLVFGNAGAEILDGALSLQDGTLLTDSTNQILTKEV